MNARARARTLLRLLIWSVSYSAGVDGWGRVMMFVQGRRTAAAAAYSRSIPKSQARDTASSESMVRLVSRRRALLCATNPALAKEDIVCCTTAWSVDDNENGMQDVQCHVARHAYFPKEEMSHDGHDEYNVNVASPREWLEHWESVDGCAGAYTVLRCDGNDNGTGTGTLCDNNNGDGTTTHPHTWTVWGRDFHLQRLKYSVLRSFSSPHDTPDTNHEMDQAMQRSDTMLDTLLTAWERTTRPLPHRSAMVTLLWTAIPVSMSATNAHHEEDTSSFTIQVRGHVCGAPCLSFILDPPTLNATLALLPVPATATAMTTSPQTTRTACSHNMPRRHDNMPDAKLSSWCRERRPLEQRYKPPFVGEVLLVRHVPHHGATGTDTTHNNNDDDVELLEGLTSNLFVLLRNGTLQTASHNHVLGGYVRHMILDDDILSSMEISYSPILLQDSHTWSAVFLTSSIRILIPIRQIFLPICNKKGDNADDGSMNMEFKEFWSMNNDRDGDQSQKVIQHIYSKILCNNLHHPKDKRLPP